MASPLKKTDTVPLGTISLKGKLLLGVINDEQIDRWKDKGEVDDDLDFAPIVAWSKQESSDFTDLKKTIGLNEAIVCNRACADLLQAIRPAKFMALCHELGLDPQRTRVFMSPDGSPLSIFIGRVAKKDPIELGSFRYNGNMTVELHEPYKAMEARKNASVDTKAVYDR